MHSSSFFHRFVSLVLLGNLVGACDLPAPSHLDNHPSPSYPPSESPQSDTSNTQPSVPQTPAESPAAQPSEPIISLAMNQWHTLQTPTLLTTVQSRAPFTTRNRYLFWQPITLTPGARYTLLARWSDGDGRLVGLSGVHPETDIPSRTPTSLTSNQFINVAGNQISGERLHKLNFQVAQENTSTTAYLTFVSTQAQQSVEIMLQFPAEPDESVLAVIDGQRHGQVRNTPLYLQGDDHE